MRLVCAGAAACLKLSGLRHLRQCCDDCQLATSIDPTYAKGYARAAEASFGMGERHTIRKVQRRPGRRRTAAEAPAHRISRRAPSEQQVTPPGPIRATSRGLATTCDCIQKVRIRLWQRATCHRLRVRLRSQAMELFETAMKLDGENQTYKKKYDQICLEWEANWNS